MRYLVVPFTGSDLYVVCYVTDFEKYLIGCVTFPYLCRGASKILVKDYENTLLWTMRYLVVPLTGSDLYVGCYVTDYENIS
jgi:predicted transcriptional regulator of viral defense system